MKKKVMKILLIYPYFLDDRIQAEDVGVVPIGLYYIGAMLRENHHDVEILNWHDMKNRDEEIGEKIREQNPDIIGFSIVHANRWGGIEIARIAKKILPNVKIVFGGIGATFLWKHLLKHFKEIDFIILGEGEYSFLNLVNCHENEQENKIHTLKGIAYRRGTKTIKTEPAEFVKDLDQLPMPSKYFSFQHVSSSRGCPSSCIFCGSPQFWGRKVRFHSPEYFVKQLEQLYQKGISFFYVSDDTFTMREDRVIEICQRIIEKGLNVRDVEALAGAQAEARGKTAKRRPRGSKSADVRALERKLSEILGLMVEINHRASGGDLRIRYKTLEQLDAVCRKLGVRH